MIKRLISSLLAVLMLMCLTSCSTQNNAEKIKVLILPKFESGEMAGDYPGEAQYYYEYYCQGGKEYEISGGYSDNKLYVKDGVALYVTGMGKTNAALSLSSVLNDERFDFSDALIVGTGCAGSAVEYGTMGDVYVISATVDAELGHWIDSRDLSDKEQLTTWYHDSEYDDSAYRILNKDLVAKVYELVKDVKLETTEGTKENMSKEFDGADWAIRDPKVLLGTSYTSDNYWKGETGHNNALLAVETYGCPDPYAATEMEDNALALTAERYGLLDHLVILRDSVNTDVFMDGNTPESLWVSDYSQESDDADTGDDIFKVAMENNFKVGKVIIDAYLNGELSID